MTRVRCLLIEDEVPATELMKSYVDQIPGWVLEKSFTNALSAIDYLSHNQVDVIFVDIQLPALSGLDFIQSLQNPPLLIITSAYSEHAVKAFELQVFDYLLKPFSFERFVQSVQRVQHALSGENSKSVALPDKLELMQNRVLRQVEIRTIRYIESRREYVEVQCENELIRSKLSLSALLEHLPSAEFFRIHRSFVVARSSITGYSHSVVELNGKSLPIGRLYRKPFLNWMTKIN